MHRLWLMFVLVALIAVPMLRAQTAVQVLPVGSTIAGANNFRFADFDLDGRTDLIVGMRDMFSKSVIVHTNLSSSIPGLMSTGTTIPITGLGNSSSVAAGDVNGDGKPDFVVVTGPDAFFQCVNQQIQVFLNTTTQVGSWSYLLQSTKAIAYSAPSVAIADILPNAGQEIIVADECSNQLHIYTNASSTAGPTEVTTLTLSAKPVQLDAVDLDGDGDADLVSSNLSIIDFVYNGGGGSLTKQPVTASSGSGQAATSLADVDGNGLMDFVCKSSPGAQLGLQIVVGQFVVTTLNLPASIFQGITSVALGDLNGDGFPDLVGSRSFGPASDVIATLNSGALPYFSGGNVLASSPMNSHAGYVGLTDLDGTPGDDLLRIQPEPIGVATLDVWRNTTPQVWSGLGSGLAGVGGIPSLGGKGSLMTGSSGSLSLKSAKPTALASLFVSLTGTGVPFKCGTLVPVPVLAQFAVFTNGAGSLTIPWASWPNSLSGLSIYFQYAIKDAAAVCGASLSNALRADVP